MESVAKTDYERMIDQFRSQLEDVWNQRKVNQLRSQVDDLRRNMDELVKSYNRLMSTGADVLGETQRHLAKQAQARIEEVTEGKPEKGVSWLIPLAVLGAAGAAYWLYNTLTSGAPEPERQAFTNYPAGFTPPMSSTETPSQEQR